MYKDSDVMGRTRQGCDVPIPEPSPGETLFHVGSIPRAERTPLNATVLDFPRGKVLFESSQRMFN